MGGSNNEYFPRSTHDGYARGSSGFSKEAEQLFRKHADPSTQPYERRVSSKAQVTIVLAYDVTGSMGDLPKIMTDKMPLFAGQLKQYLGHDIDISLAGVGDVGHDKAPLQVADFVKLRQTDESVGKIWLEAGGGSNSTESYEYAAFYYANYFNSNPSSRPYFIFVADEGIREYMVPSIAQRVFGDHFNVQQDISVHNIFAELKRKFNNNVFLIHRKYGSDESDRYALTVWRKVLGDEHIIKLGSDQSICDVMIGLLAIVSGARTLDAYLQDMVTARDKPQSEARIAEVREALKVLNQPAKTKTEESAKTEGKEKPKKPALPTPDEVNQLVSEEIKEQIGQYMCELRDVLTDKDRRPKVWKDGWVYVDGINLPKEISDESCDAFLELQSQLRASNWTGSLAKENPQGWTLKIRRFDSE